MFQKPAVGEQLKFKRNKPFPCLKKYLWNPHSDRQVPEVIESCTEFLTHSPMGHVSLSRMAVWKRNTISHNTSPCDQRWLNDSEAFFKSSRALLESLTYRRNSGEVVILCLAQSFLLTWGSVLLSGPRSWKPSAPPSQGSRKQESKMLQLLFVCDGFISEEESIHLFYSSLHLRNLI